MNLQEISEKLQAVSDHYARKFSIRRDQDWFLLKIQEEVGELASCYLKLTGRGRRRQGIDEAQLRLNLSEELADVLAMTMLLARDQGIDLSEALQKKWFCHLES